MSEKRSESADLSALRIKREDGPVPSQPNFKYKNFILGLALFAVAVIVYLIFSRLKSEPTFNVAVVKKIFPSQFNAVLTASGYVVAQTQAAIASKGTGRLVYLGVEEGDVVKKGEIIALLEHNDVDAAFEQAQANLKMAKADLLRREAEFHEAKLNNDRQENLFEKGLISKSEYDIAEARFKIANAAIAAAEAQIDLSAAGVVSAQVDVQNTKIRAPFDGTVLSKNADIGEMVAPFAASSNSRGAVVTIADMNSLEVEADVSESNIQKVKLGQSCEIILDAFPEQRYPGVVHKIVPTADRAKATVLTKIRFVERDEKVLPEMSAKVNFLSGPQQIQTLSEAITVIPKSAIIEKNGRKVVFLLRGNVVSETPVSVGRKFGGQVEIVSGVTAGEKVILDPGDDLKTGTEISIVE